MEGTPGLSSERPEGPVTRFCSAISAGALQTPQLALAD